MKKTILYIFIVASSFCNGQVGIGTATPQKDLHVAGTTSTIRVESLSAANNPPALNDGVKLAPVFVDENGDLTLKPTGYIAGGGSPGAVAPLNFLLVIPNFIPDGPAYNGVVINNSTLTTTASRQLASVPFTSPQSALIEVKYGVTIVVSQANLNTTPAGTVFNDMSARSFQVYFCIDLNSNGLDGTELSKKYGYKGQAYASSNQGILGYPYMNSHGYANIPAGNHQLVFFGESIDGIGKSTSIGFGGDIDYLKIRLFN